jgi:hypothetical protein
MAISNGAFAGWNQIGGSDTNYAVVGVGAAPPTCIAQKRDIAVSDERKSRRIANEENAQ